MLLLFTLSACGECGGCGQGEQATESPKVTAPLVAQAKPDPAPAAEPPAPTPKTPPSHKVVLEDLVPICAFGEYRDFDSSKYPDEIVRGRLQAGKPVVFGAYPGWCVKDECDEGASLQCHVDREGQTLAVHTRYWGARKEGMSCAKTDCNPIVAACLTPPLEKGTYTVQYGDQTFTLRVPGKPPKPCFGMNEREYVGPDDF